MVTSSSAEPATPATVTGDRGMPVPPAPRATADDNTPPDTAPARAPAADSTVAPPPDNAAPGIAHAAGPDDAAGNTGADIPDQIPPENAHPIGPARDARPTPAPSLQPASSDHLPSAPKQAPPGGCQATTPRPDIRRETTPVSYTTALAAMTERNAAIAAGTASEWLWLLEHPPVYTAGTSAQATDLLDPRFEVVEAGRGGKYTYHGPGQRIAYVLIDLNARGRDVRRFVHALEGWVIATLGDFGVEAWRSDTGVGIWTQDIDGREAKIGAIGVRVRRWVTMHGLSVNLAPDLAHFGGIVPCGIAEAGVTSLARIGRPVSTEAWDAALLARFDAFLDAIATPCGPRA